MTPEDEARPAENRTGQGVGETTSTSVPVVAVQTVSTDWESGIVRGSIWFEPTDVPVDNRLGVPIPTDHSGAISRYYQWLKSRLPIEAVVALTDERGRDCIPAWGAGVCVNEPCADDAGRSWWQATCAEFAATVSHRFRAGASMRHDEELTTIGGAS